MTTSFKMTLRAMRQALALPTKRPLGDARLVRIQWSRPRGVVKLILSGMLTLSLTVTPVHAQDLDRAVGALIGAIISGAIQGQQRQQQQSTPRQQRSQPSRPAISQAQRQATREVQTALNFFEFSAGGVDGLMGPNTRGAIRSFQQTMGFEATGSLTDRERDFLVGSYHRARHAGGIPRDSRILAQDGPQALLRQYRQDIDAPISQMAQPHRPDPSSNMPASAVSGTGQTATTGSAQDGPEIRRTIRGFGNQGIDFTIRVSARLTEGGAIVTLEAASGRHNPDANFNAIDLDETFGMGLHVVTREICEGCRPGFVERSPEVMRFEGGTIVVDALPVEVFVPASALEGADEIGLALFGKNLLFLAPESALRISDLPLGRRHLAAHQEQPSGGDTAAMQESMPIPQSSEALFGPHAVLDFNSVNHCVQYIELDRFLGCLSDAGASEAGVAAARALSGEGGSAFLSDYWPLGRVDAVETVSQSASNVHWHGLVIDGNRHIPAGFDHMSARDGASRNLQRRYPNAASMSPTWISGHRYLESGGQRFILTGVITDGCRACDVIAVAIGYVDFRDGRPVNSGTIGWAEQRGSYPTSVAEIRRRLNARDVREMQTQLNLRGYIAGAMDGAYGPNTAGALREFRREHCLGDNAEWTQETTDLLAPRERFDMRLDAAPCGPGPQQPASTAVSNADLAAFPLREGVYARSAEYCRLEDFEPADYTDGIASVRRLFEDNAMHYYESVCHVDGATQRDGQVHVTYTCSGEGNTWPGEAIFENVSETGFTEVTEDDPFLHEAADFVYSDIRGNVGYKSFQHCDVLLGETPSASSEIVADEAQEVGTGLTRENAGADEFNIFTYLMEEFCVGRDCSYFTGRRTSECTPDCVIEGVAGSYLARSISPEQAHRLLVQSGEHTMVQTQQGVPYGFEGRLAENQVDGARSFRVFREACETDQCESLLVSIISEGEGYIADVAAGADRKEIDSVYSTLDTDNDCSLLEGLPGDDPGHAYSSVMRCQGADRHEVILGDYHLRMQLHYVGSDLTDRYHAQEGRASEGFAEFNHVHDVVEWRRRKVDGAMEPFATIHRWFVQLEQPGGPSEHPMLLVQTVASAPGEESCIVGYVDAHANPNANEIAKRVADEVAPRFECGIDEMQSHGDTTDRTPHPARIVQDTPDRTADDTEEDLPTEVLDPLSSMRLTAGYLDPVYRASQNRQHLGADYGAPVGTEVRSPVTGVVVSNNTLDTEDGNLKRVIIRDGATGHEHVLGHIDSDLEEGVTVQQGDVVGSIVSAGTGPHLHWGINRTGVSDAMGHGWGWGRAHANATQEEAEARGWADPERYRAESVGAAPLPGDASADEDAAPPQAGDEMVALEDLRLAAGFLDLAYADRHDRQLLGLDLRGGAGTVLRAPISGMIMGNRTGPDVPAAEKWLILREPATGQEHVFGHVVSALEPGQEVNEDDLIGEIDEGGRVYWGINRYGIWQAVDTADGWGWAHGPGGATVDEAQARGWIDPAALFSVVASEANEPLVTRHSGEVVSSDPAPTTHNAEPGSEEIDAIDESSSKSAASTESEYAPDAPAEQEDTADALALIEDHFTAALGVDSDYVQLQLIDAGFYTGDLAPFGPDGRHSQWKPEVRNAFQAALDYARAEGIAYDLSSENGYYAFVGNVRAHRLAAGFDVGEEL